MTGVREDDDGEAGEGGDDALPAEPVDGAAVREGVAFGVVVDDEDDEVCDGYEGDDGGILETVEAAEEREGNDD